jgi:putative addiction module CopG family antidote
MANRTTLNVSLPLEMGQFIMCCVRSGRISSASEVVRAGLRLLQAEEEKAAAGSAAIFIVNGHRGTGVFDLHPIKNPAIANIRVLF